MLMSDITQLPVTKNPLVFFIFPSQISGIFALLSHFLYLFDEEI